MKGVWSVPSRLCEEVNAAFRAHDFVIIYFLVRALKGMYGVARMGLVCPPPPSFQRTVTLCLLKMYKVNSFLITLSLSLGSLEVPYPRDI